MGRERRCQHARRPATDAIERQAELRLTDSRFDPVRDIRRVDDNDVSADRPRDKISLNNPAHSGPFADLPFSRRFKR